ncbi:hypothetical protein [Candidatus Electronema sp. PJ]|uniref:hypothetical protein n=1 Tax=Candidatus Electronema sp. PJ TaxID=3401572 RepID=UPI003AA84F4E
MPYGTFATYEDVAIKFKIKLAERSFVQKLNIPVDRALLGFIGDNLKTRRSYVSENAICESIISPILNIVAKKNGIPVWSHVRFDVSEEEGLVGIPDFIIAPASEIGTVFRNPVICITEAKKENFNEGWAQALAEMIAAQKFNSNVEQDIFGIVTTGNFWQFGKLRQNVLTMETVSYSAAENLQLLFDILNWLVAEAKKSIPQQVSTI